MAQNTATPDHEPDEIKASFVAALDDAAPNWTPSERASRIRASSMGVQVECPGAIVPVAEKIADDFAENGFVVMGRAVGDKGGVVVLTTEEHTKNLDEFKTLA